MVPALTSRRCAPHPLTPVRAVPLPLPQLAASEQNYAELFEQRETESAFWGKVDAEMQRASQEYLRDKRQWQEQSDADVKTIADLQKQLAAERGARITAETQLAILQVGAAACQLMGAPCPLACASS